MVNSIMIKIVDQINHFLEELSVQEVLLRKLLNNNAMNVMSAMIVILKELEKLVMVICHGNNRINSKLIIYLLKILMIDY